MKNTLFRKNKKEIHQLSYQSPIQCFFYQFGYFFAVGFGKDISSVRGHGMVRDA